MNGHYYKTKSKSRTFAKKTDLIKKMQKTNIEHPEFLDEIKHKYIITITKIEDNAPLNS